MRRRGGTFLLVMGLGFLCAAALFLRYNLRIQTRAGDRAQEVISALEVPGIEEETRKGSNNPVTTAPQTDSHVRPENPKPDYVLNPQMPMPEKEVDGVSYVGILSIPTLALKLPVIANTSSAGLQIAPCRYTGSAYLDDLVIGAHNYSTHFGRIKELQYGDLITFTDMDGNVFSYIVADMEVLKPHQVEDLCDGKWPLSLYTCTFGGRTRVTIRCEKAVVYE